MHTTFYFGYQNVALPLPGFVITTPTEMVIATLLMFTLALCYEKLKVAREELLSKADHESQPQLLSWPHFHQTLLYVLQVLLSYLLMLTIMTYNAYLTLAVFAGACIGYLGYRWKNTMNLDMDLADPCH